MFLFDSLTAINEQNVKLTVSGYISDSKNGEELIGVTIFVKESGQGVISNSYGYYSLSLLPGEYTIVYVYMGYNTLEKKINVSKNLVLSVELSEDVLELSEAVVVGEKSNINITRKEMSVNRLDINAIKHIPALMGEVDVIKSIQLLPGVQATSEGSSGYSVRGGARDHNLIILDEATVYNASHLMGFFSVFNNDAIRDVKLYKGDIPASHGGRLASVLDVRMKEGNNKYLSATGGIGTLASRLTLEGPILSEQTSFIISGRRTYLDLFFPASSDQDIKDSKLYFYDLNFKINHRFNNSNRIFISSYMGKDVFNNKNGYFGFGNKTLTLRWNHLVSSKLFFNTSFIYSRYDYSLRTGDEVPNGFIWDSNMQDLSVKLDFNYFLNSNNYIRFGLQTTHHKIIPCDARGKGSSSLFDRFLIPANYSLEHGVYFQNEQNIGDKFGIKYGFRVSLFQNIGESKVYEFDENYKSIGYKEYGSNVIYNTYSNIEPRLGFTYAINSAQSIKGSYSRTVQYIQQASNSTAGMPLDVWFTSSPNIKPQTSDQIGVGFFQNLFDNKIEASAELYYKEMGNVIDFVDFADLLINEKVEGEVRRGRANAYGVELMMQFVYGKVDGWLGYTYSRTSRVIPDLNNGNRYRSPYDKPHDVSIVLGYEFSPKWKLSFNWVFSSGIPTTFPAGKYEIMGNVIPIYTERNAFRYPDYHRLDLGITYKPRVNLFKKWQGEWNLSIYNLYNRKNAWVINFIQDKNKPNETYAERTSLFGLVPSLTYNFKF